MLIEEMAGQGEGHYAFNLARQGHGNACNGAFCGPAQVAPLCN